MNSTKRLTIYMKNKLILLIIAMLFVVTMPLHGQESNEPEYVPVAVLDSCLKKYYDHLTEYCNSGYNENSDGAKLFRECTKTGFDDIPLNLYIDVQNCGNLEKNKQRFNTGKIADVQKLYLGTIEKEKVKSFKYKLYNNKKDKVKIEEIHSGSGKVYYSASISVWVIIEKSDKKFIECAEKVTFIKNSNGEWPITGTEWEDKPEPLSSFMAWLAFDDSDESYWGMDILFTPYTKPYANGCMWGLSFNRDYVLDTRPNILLGFGLGWQRLPAYNHYITSSPVLDISEGLPTEYWYQDDQLLFFDRGPVANTFDLSLRVGTEIGHFHIGSGIGPILSTCKDKELLFNFHIINGTRVNKPFTTCTLAIRPMIRYAFDEDWALSVSCLLTPFRYQTFQGFCIGFSKIMN